MVTEARKADAETLVFIVDEYSPDLTQKKQSFNAPLAHYNGMIISLPPLTGNGKSPQSEIKRFQKGKNNFPRGSS